MFSGYITDKYKKKKPIAFAGYATGFIYKLALLLASSWTGILTARVIDRLGKGIRTSPRDVMVSESADKNQMGKAFGIHKALDMAGSAIGILLSYLLPSSQRPDAAPTAQSAKAASAQSPAYAVLHEEWSEFRCP